MLIIILIVLILAIGGGGYYMGPGLGYYSGGAIDIILELIVIYLIYGRNRSSCEIARCCDDVTIEQSW